MVLFRTEPHERRRVSRTGGHGAGIGDLSLREPLDQSRHPRCRRRLSAVYRKKTEKDVPMRVNNGRTSLTDYAAHHRLRRRQVSTPMKPNAIQTTTEAGSWTTPEFGPTL